ncbi:MAG TPA: HAD-IIIA family hydrolase [Lacibacter sp.]|nr:HAD-IIIA family hydrolase [Lacibacter sp.]HMO89737.1 HAD-IIIA family hydrolase [Lacibacter sp.]HMP87646.1 HAD-IIIA family hydrolase [Lacibacter sp.]
MKGNMNVTEQFQQIKAFVFDLDGVLTDGTLQIFPNQEFIRTMDIKDGYALQLAVRKGYPVVIISGSYSKPCAERLDYLGIRDVYMKVRDKEEVLAQYLLANHLHWEQVLYMGDDIPDLDVMRLVGLPCCPADAVSEIKAVAQYISPKNGGRGAARDVVEKVLRLQHNWAIAATDTASR